MTIFNLSKTNKNKHQVNPDAFKLLILFILCYNTCWWEIFKGD